MSEAEPEQKGLTRRGALKAGAAAAGGVAIAGGLLGSALEVAASPAVVGNGPYGPMQPVDANGMMLPQGFTSKIVARTGQDIGPRPYDFHVAPDGMGTFKTDDGGFVLVSNSESLTGGAGAIRFNSSFQVTDAYRILENTLLNCAGGVTPWNTWLSCEEIENGKVFECDPFGNKAAVARPAMGVFKHEACAVDPVGKKVYLTEDLGNGCLYRFSPASYPDLSRGLLEVAIVADDGQVSWATVPDPEFTAGVPTRMQVPDADKFKRGEGMWYDDGVVYFATTQDDRVYALHCATQTLEVLYDGVALGSASPLHKTDNVTVSPTSGDLYVAEDGDNLQICIVSAEGEVAAFLELPGPEHFDSELTGPVFDPTGHRLYFSSQRMKVDGVIGGVIFEVTGPFRRTRAEPEPPDQTGPVLKVRTLGKPALERLLRVGQTFELTVTDDSPPVAIKAKLVTKLMRSNGRRTQDVTIGQVETRVAKSGKKKIRVKVGKRHAAKLRKRDVAQARLIVTATDAEGNRRRTVKPVRFT